MKKIHVYNKLNCTFNLIKSDLNDSKSKENIIYKVIHVKMYLLLILFMPLNNVKSQLLISQYIETNSGTTPKGIEIYNYSNSPIVFSNSNNLQISLGSNGGSCSLLPGTNITIGTLAAGKVWVIGTNDLTSYAQTNTVNLSGFTNYNFDFNGNDALTLSLGGVIMDVFGTCGNDPGTSWAGSGVATENQNIQVLSTISTGTTSYWTNPSLRFETVSTTNQMTGFGTAPSFSTLPVELTSFSSICDDNDTISINWTTASEHNSDYYTLEKSRDGINWNTLATKDAAGNSTQLVNYSVVDNSEISGTVYYRLTQVDEDGATKVYDIVSANCALDQQLSLLAYPNPSNGQFNVKVETSTSGDYSLSVVDLHGKIQHTYNFELKNGTTILNLEEIQLKPGVYFIQLVNKEAVMVVQQVAIY